jgi:beta-lactamase class A
MTASSRAEAEIARIAGFAQGRVGLAGRHLESGATIGLNAGEIFPMASTMKVPLAMAVLDRVDHGTLGLATMVDVSPQAMNPSGPLGEEFLHPGVALSVLNLMEPMITRSDNTATDALLRLVGGPSGVMAYLDRLGLSGITVSRSIRDLLVALYGMDPPRQDMSVRDTLRSAEPAHLAVMRAHATNRDPAYSDDPRDQSTPDGMLDLLVRLWRAEAVGAASRDLLLAIMRRTSTGSRRIEGRLPPGVAVANKTGSASGTTNDIGFVTLPDGRGTLAIVVYVKDSALAAPHREEIIADVARTAYDWAMMTAP